jgi:homoserine O-succinyltransferase
METEMIIALPQGLPAAATLRREGISVIEERDDMLAMFAPVRIALLNLMPDKQTTEAQFARRLGRAPHPVELTLIRPASHRSRGTDADYMDRFYTPWPEVASQPFDGLIVTGAPVEQLAFTDVTYWPELTAIFDWATQHVSQALYVCWAGQAFLRHRYGIEKQQMFTKLFGVYDQSVTAPEDPAMDGIGPTFPTPASRHTEVHEEDLEAEARLSIVARSDAAGACMVRDRASNALINFNHLEYDADTLAREYLRDREAAREILLPENYFPDNDPGAKPRQFWAGAAQAVFSNWVRDAHAARRGKPRDTGLSVGSPRP